MSGDWIKMRGNLWDDPRVARLCDITEQSEATIIGALYWLWATADQHTENGVMPGLTIRSIDRKTGVKGFADALITIGWLADHPEGVRIVNFEDHNGVSAKKRCQTAKRVATHRTANADVTHEALQKEQDSVNTALAREEKRREEEKAKDDAAASVIPIDPVKQIFDRGAALIGGDGKSARGLLGKLRKAHGDLAVMEAISRGEEIRPSDPIPWLVKACEAGVKKTNSAADALGEWFSKTGHGGVQ